MAQVIDASVAVAWCARSQATDLTEAALEAVVAIGGHIPAIFWFEVLHSLVGLEHRGILPRIHVDEFAERLAEFPLLIDAARNSFELVNLYRFAREHRLNMYDASYLELALRLRLPLATRDASLARAAQTAGVTLFTA